jgi:anaerobic selenocysteine-containing dehydrogenase
VSRRQARNVNSARYVRSHDDEKDLPDLHVHPADASDAGVSEGGRVRLRTSAGALEATASFDDGLRRGVVSLTHGWSAPNVNRLLSQRQADPLTGQPQLSAIAVSVEPLTPPAERAAR